MPREITGTIAIWERKAAPEKGLKLHQSERIEVVCKQRAAEPALVLFAQFLGKDDINTKTACQWVIDGVLTVENVSDNEFHPPDV